MLLLFDIFTFLLFILVNIVLFEPFWILFIFLLLDLTSILLFEPLNTTFDNKHFLWVAFILFDEPLTTKFITSFLKVILFLFPDIVNELISPFTIKLELLLSNINCWCYYINIHILYCKIYNLPMYLLNMCYY